MPRDLGQATQMSSYRTHVANNILVNVYIFNADVRPFTDVIVKVVCFDRTAAILVCNGERNLGKAPKLPRGLEGGGGGGLSSICIKNWYISRQRKVLSCSPCQRPYPALTSNASSFIRSRKPCFSWLRAADYPILASRVLLAS